MPSRPPRLCDCGAIVPAGQDCACAARRARERKARADARRPTARARGYDGRWEAARAAFLAAHPTCARCAEPATVVDHVIPHRGDMVLFWDRTNWQPLCRHHHSRDKQREESRR